MNASQISCLSFVVGVHIMLAVSLFEFMFGDTRNRDGNRRYGPFTIMKIWSGWLLYSLHLALNVSSWFFAVVALTGVFVFGSVLWCCDEIRKEKAKLWGRRRM